MFISYRKTGLLCLVLTISFACSKSNGYQAPVPQPPPIPPLITLPAEWTKATSLTTGFPAGIEVYRNTTAFSGKALNAYCVIFDPKDASIDFKPVTSTTLKKPSEFYNEETGTKYAAINGGFFGGTSSYSLVMYNNTIASVNIRALTRTYNGANASYYPTRGAFGLTAGFDPQVTWIYNVANDKASMYSYPAPSPNVVGSAPQAVPSATFPAGGSLWNVNSAIGGSPVLIKNNTINITDAQELIDIDNTISRARSAIGYTAAGKVVILAVEGNNTSGGAGLSLAEVAALMKNLGCTDALNLDGGGSTALTVNGQQTVKPSDAGGERPVSSAIIIRRK